MEVLDGPETPVKARTFNVLVVISGEETRRSTLDCASNVAPYDIHTQEEVMIAVQRLKQGFEHPNPTLNAARGDTQWASSNFYHEAENWVTIAISMLEPSAYNLNYTMIRLFDLPDVICEQNSACIGRSIWVDNGPSPHQQTKPVLKQEVKVGRAGQSVNSLRQHL